MRTLTFTTAAVVLGAWLLGLGACSERSEGPAQPAAGPAAQPVAAAAPAEAAPAPAAPAALTEAATAEKKRAAETLAREAQLKRPVPGLKGAPVKGAAAAEKAAAVGRPAPPQAEAAPPDHPLRKFTPAELSAAAAPGSAYPAFDGKTIALVHTENVVGELEPCG